MPRQLIMKQKKPKGGQVWYPLQLNLVPKPTPGPNELVVKIEAAALNHREIFQRQNLYPKVSFRAPMMSDGCGTVIEEGPGCQTGLLNKRVIMTVCRGWKTSQEGPEDWENFDTVGGTEPHYHLGMAQDYLLVHEDEVEPAPEHLTSIEAAALPGCGITAWRALMTKSGNALPGRNILITGIGGGAALQTMQMALAIGCNVYVTSGSEEKLEKAKALGAKALSKLLPADRPYIDAVIDSAGGDIVIKSVNILKPGGIITMYGMTLAPILDWPMQAIFKNIELRGSTLGSRTEFHDMVNFIKEKKITPIISRTVQGLDCVDAIDGLMDDMKTGVHFGKLVVEI
ncbi:hypothetical protein N7468_006107 [Penicillium chermesinum]|uniref:Enoyl reductase (ER) domain-containing protein n=1 Tax=Penicillium chermesinum TaxID=63820 RepID=A0A9W9TNL0_9EURO|nr:uncharacterized protein N7468_006107 [Penicillium chermesinum]KAJ5233151.1 hypothetical protein N7468_006107 [Penicillium chermesinum]